MASTQQQHSHLPQAVGSGTGRIFGLDALRCAAIAGVMVAHALPVLYPHNYRLGLLGHGGFFGVELFFVLSGFLIGRILIQLGPRLRHPAVLAEFYVRRWFRTLPLFWLFLAINVAIEWWGRAHRLTSAEVLGHAFFLRNLDAPRMAFFAESWSLAVEEWFYLLFPAALLVGLWVTTHFTRVLLAVALGFYLFSTAGRLHAAVQPNAVWDGATRMVVLNRFDALMTGVLAAWVMHAFPNFWKRSALPLLLAGLALAFAMYASLWRPEGEFFTAAKESFFGRTFRFNLVSLAFALLLPALSRWTIQRENLATSAVRKIALWSYSLYLVHGPVIWFMQQYCFPGARTLATAAYLSFASQLLLSVLASAALYAAFERPITRLREKAGPAVADFFGNEKSPI